MTEVNIEPIVATENEKADLAKLAQILNLLNHSHGDRQLQIMDGETGEAIPLPQCILQLLRQAVHQFNQGKGVVIETFHQPLTINEAAYLLNFSRPHLEQLLEQGEIPFIEGEIQRQIQLADVIAYHKKWQNFQQNKLAEIVEISEESGLYSADCLNIKSA